MGVAAADGPPLPAARGPLTSALFERLASPPETGLAGWPMPSADAGWDEDVQLALYTCYELHYRGFDGVSDEWEWDPGLLGFRRDLERCFLRAVRDELGTVPPLDEQLDALLTVPVGPPGGVSGHLLEDGKRWQAREYLVHRSTYHLKEADPQAFAIPRVHGAAQAALVEIEYDEYGAGRPDQVHSRLFADMMADFGLRIGYGAYVDAVPAATLATVNLMSLFGLHREHRGALIGQFARTEITSSLAARRLVEAFERLGAGEPGTRFYREHVEADAVHEQLVRHGVIGAMVKLEPRVEPDIAFGIAAAGLTEDRFGRYVLGEWERGASSLLCGV